MNSFRRYSAYGLAYLLWFLSFLLSGLVLLQLRDAYLSVIVLSMYNRAQNNAAQLFYSNLAARSLDQWSYLFLGILLIVLIVFFEHYYRTGVQPGRLRLRFFQVIAIEFVVLFASNLTSAIVAWQVGGFTWRSLYYPILELLTGAIFIWLWLDARRRKATEITGSQPS